jgi:putative endonuclease
VNAAERRAVWWYRLRGYRILATNAWAGGHEVDVIVRRGRIVRFVEVKSKSGTRFGEAVEMVDAEKLCRVQRAAGAWLAAHPECRSLRVSFDIVAVDRDRLRRIPDVV